MTAPLREGRGGFVLGVKVRPRAARARVGPVTDGLLKVAVTEPPEGGRANRAVKKTLAKKLGIAQSRLELVSGAGSRKKAVLIQGLSAREIAQRLGLDD